jgi:hypothetical protein
MTSARRWINPRRALAVLQDAGPGTAKAKKLEPVLVASARNLDLRRARGLARLIESRARPSSGD